MQLRAWLNSAKQTLAECSESPSIDAEILACFVLEASRAFLYTHPEEPLSASQLERLESFLKRRLEGEPIAYLTGKQEFYSLPFNVTKDVLIPRSDTELLVSLTLKELKGLQAPKVLDLGTGSGAIALSIAKNCPKAHLTAIDQSPKALAVAKSNQTALNIENVEFLKSDWFKDLASQRFDIIVSNPPYIDRDDPHLDENTRRFEPESALISPAQGLHDIEHIIKESRNWLKPHGKLIIEHGFQQAELVAALFLNYGYKSISYYRDLQQNPRAIVAEVNNHC